MITLTNDTYSSSTWQTFYPGSGFNAYGLVLAVAPATTVSDSDTLRDTMQMATDIVDQTSSDKTTATGSRSTSTGSASGDTTLSGAAQHGGLTSGAKAGVAVGTILGVALLAAIFWFGFRRGRRSRTDSPLDGPSSSKDLADGPATSERMMARYDEPPQELLAVERPSELGPARSHEMEHVNRARELP